MIQTGPIQRLAFLKRNAEFCCGSIQVVFSHFFNTSTSGGVCMFLSTVMISHVGKLGMFPGMFQTAVSFFHQGLCAVFRHCWCFQTSYKLSFCCGLRRGQDLGRFECMGRGVGHTGNPGSQPSAYWESNTVNCLGRERPLRSDHSIN